MAAALPDQAGPFAFLDHFDLAKRDRPTERFAKRLLGREPGGEPLRGERSPSRPGVGDLLGGVQALERAVSPPAEERLDPRHLDQIEA